MDEFEQFWAAYPKKRDKGAARTAWAKSAKMRPGMQELLAAIERGKQCADWQKDNGQYIPYPATWLNGERWADEYEINLGANVSGKAWYETSTGIEAKGRELGVNRADYETFPAYRVAVHAAAGMPILRAA